MLWLAHVNLKKDIAHHCHNVHEFVVCLEGEINIHTDKQSYQLAAGQAIFIPEKISHSASICQSTNNQLLFSCVDASVFDSLATEANRIFLKKLTQTVSLSTTNPTEMLSISEEMLKIINDDSPLKTCIKENLFLKLLLTHISGDMALQTNIDDPAAERMSLAKSWIEKHYTEEVTLEKVAQQVNMSRSHFARQFRQHTGFSVIDYLLKVRCDAVAGLLIQSNTDISEIAFSVGFSNLSHFYRHFKKRYGSTPRAFRQMIRNQGVALSA
mgnify:CR=1 FL=1